MTKSEKVHWNTCIYIYGTYFIKMDSRLGCLRTPDRLRLHKTVDAINTSRIVDKILCHLIFCLIIKATIPLFILYM